MFDVEETSIQDMAVQMSEINTQTNQAVLNHSVPAKFVEIIYRPSSAGRDTSSFDSNNRNNNPLLSGPVGGLCIT